MKRHQKGMHTVEFAVVGFLFLMLVFAVLEVARAMFVWNTLTEATRRGARMAAVCPYNDPAVDDAIKNVTVFNAPGTSGPSPIVSGLSSSNVVVERLDKDGNATTVYNDMRFVRVKITGFQFQVLVPALVPIPALTAPEFATTIPRESLGQGPSVSCL